MTRLSTLPPWNIELKPWPFWCQLRDPEPPGIPVTNAANDCGPEAVSMCLRYLTGVELPADFIKDQMHGLAYQGYTSVPDLENWFERYSETPAQTIFVHSAHELAWYEWKFLKQGKPLIGLFSGTAPGAADGHFRAIIGRTPGTCVTADPWTGLRRVETLDDHWAWSKGLVIGIHRKRQV